MKTKTVFLPIVTRACALFALAAICASTSRAAPAFTQANITDLAGEVSITPVGGTKSPAKLNDVFRAQQLMETGRKSRVQLENAGTIARVGSNTLFSFEATGAEPTVHLTSGSVLFSAPKGVKSNVITGGATATVEGFTVIASATADGGFKLLVLEGTATIKLANGQIVTLTPGQMTYVLPASKGGGVGPTLNFDLKKETQSSGLVNGFTLSLPSENLIVDATNLQQLKITSGQLTPTGQVAVGAVSSDQVFLVDSTTFDNVGNVNNPPPNTSSGPDLVLGPTAGLTLPAANTFVSPGKTFSAGDLGLPNGVIPGNSVTINGLVGGNVSASGIVDLSSLDGVPTVGILAQKSFSFTTMYTNISHGNETINPAFVFFSNSTAPYITDFSELQTTLHLEVTAKNGFTFNPMTIVSTTFGPPIFTNITNFTTAIHPTLVGPTIDFSSSNFRTNFVLTSVLADFDPEDISFNNQTGNLKLQSLVGDVYLNGDFVQAGSGGPAGGDVIVQSKLAEVKIYDGQILPGGSANSSIFVNAGTDVHISSGESGSFIQANLGNGTIQITARGDVAVDHNSQLHAAHLNIFAHDLVTLSSININNTSNSNYTTIIGGDTVNLDNLNFTGQSKVNLYSRLGVLHSGTPVDGDVNFITGVTYNGSSAASEVGSNIKIGITADNPDVQTALGTATTLGSTPPPSNQIFSNVLFTPEQTGASVGDNYYFIGNGVFGGAVTASGNVDLTGVPVSVIVDVGAYNGFTISGNTNFVLPALSNNTGLRLYSRLGFTITPGAVITNNLSFNFSNNFAFEMDSLVSTTFNNVTISSPNSTVTLASEEGSLSYTGGAIVAGNFGGGGGGVNLVSYGPDQAVNIAGATISGNSFFNGTVNVLADNVNITANTVVNGTIVNIVGGTVGVTVANSTLRSSAASVNVVSDTDININNSTVQSSSTPVGSSFTNGRVNLTAAHVVTVKNSTLITPRPVILAGSAINFDGVSMSNSTNIDMQARTINLSNINFPGGSTVNLTSQNGMLAPNPNTNAASVIGDVNFITNVMYNGSPAQNFVPISVGGNSESSESNHINISSGAFH